MDVSDRIWKHVCDYTLHCFCERFDYFDSKFTRESMEHQLLHDGGEIADAVQATASMISQDALKRYLEFPTRFEQSYFAPMTRLLQFFNNPHSDLLDNGWLWWVNYPAMFRPFQERIESFLKSVSGAADRRRMMSRRLLTHLDFCVNWYAEYDDAHQPIRDRLTELLMNSLCARWLFIDGLDVKFYDPADPEIQCPVKPARARRCIDILIGEYKIQLVSLEVIQVETQSLKVTIEDLSIVCDFLNYGKRSFIRKHDQTEIRPEAEWMPSYERHSLGEIAKVTNISKTDLNRHQSEYVRTNYGWFPIIKMWRDDTFVLKDWLNAKFIQVKMDQRSARP